MIGRWAMLVLALGMAVSAPAAVKWHKDLEAAKREAKKRNVPILVDFYADWCGPCKQLTQYTFPDPKVQKFLATVVPVKIDTDAPQNAKWVRSYGVGPIPAVGMLKPDGTLVIGVTGFRPPDEFLRFANEARKRVMATAKKKR